MGPRWDKVKGKKSHLRVANDDGGHGSSTREEQRGVMPAQCGPRKVELPALYSQSTPVHSPVPLEAESKFWLLCADGGLCDHPRCRSHTRG